jgi:hypothetical protein
MYERKPKHIHAELKNPGQTRVPPLRAVKSDTAPTGLASTPGQIITAVTDHFASLLKPPMHDTHEIPPFPFERSDLPDNMQLVATPINENERETMPHFQTFMTVVQHLPTGKAPGPDGILNETIKYLPGTLLWIIYTFILQLLGGEAPPAVLTESDTILLYKKGDPRELNNYRPIGLSNTIYKLWTRLIAREVSDFSERNNVFHQGQAWFRRHYYTHIQTQLLTAVIEDASRRQKDLYSLQIDFTNAFNRVNHKKLLHIMSRLGYPARLIRLVNNVYSSSTTSIVTPFGKTKHMRVQRGTIQGDSLSPVMFAIYIEPLLRWLHTGARGYPLQTGTTESTEVSNLSTQMT